MKDLNPFLVGALQEVVVLEPDIFWFIVDYRFYPHAWGLELLLFLTLLWDSWDARDGRLIWIVDILE